MGRLLVDSKVGNPFEQHHGKGMLQRILGEMARVEGNFGPGACGGV